MKGGGNEGKQKMKEGGGNEDREGREMGEEA